MSGMVNLKSFVGKDNITDIMQLYSVDMEEVHPILKFYY